MKQQKNNFVRDWKIAFGKALALSFAVCGGLVSQHVSAKDIVVVQSLDLSGQSNLGKDFSNGVRTYFDAINAKGGIRGRKIQFVQLDDSGDSQQTATNLKTLLRENEVDAVLAPTTGSSFIAATKDQSLKNSGHVLFGAPTGVRPADADASRAITIRASYNDEARQLLNHISLNGMTSIVLVRGDGEEADYAATAFREEAKKLNKTLAFDGDSKQWQKRTAVNQSLEAVVLTGDAVGVAPSLMHARATAKAAQLFGFSTIDHRVLFELAKANAIGMVISQAMPSPEKSVHPFQREHRALMKQFRDEPPSLHTLEGYVVARMLVSALTLTGGSLSASSVAAALRSANDLDLGPMSVSTRVPANAMRYVSLSVVSKKGALLD